jgi:H+/Cl- antiporter ClcA
MRLLLVLIVVVVFAALMLFDTAALFRLTWYCATGECGFSSLWTVAVVGAIVLLAVVSRWRPKAKAKPAPRRVAKAKIGAKKKPKRPAVKRRPGLKS